MASKLNPYINFDTEAEAAMNFYQSVLGGNLTVSRFADMPGSEGLEGVMHAQLETEAGYTIMASDTPPGMERSSGAQIVISISGDASDGDKLRGYFAALAEGGTITLPLATQMWGDDFGMLTDQFGIGWMVDITPAS